MDEYVTREESKSEKPDEKGVLQTLSKQLTGPVRVRIEWHIKEFASMMSSYETGRSIWSGGVSSKRENGAVWRLEIYPSGERRLTRSHASVFLHLTGPLVESEESLEARYHLYLDGGFCGAKSSIVRDDDTFGPWMEYAVGDSVSHAAVKRTALRKDGSLVVVAEVEFPVPRRRR